MGRGLLDVRDVNCVGSWESVVSSIVSTDFDGLFENRLPGTLKAIDESIVPIRIEVWGV